MESIFQNHKIQIMKKILFLFSTAILGGLTAQAQITTYETIAQKSLETKNIDTVAWVRSGNVSLGINQGLLHNWQAGGELLSLTVSGLVDGTITRYNHRKIWTTNLNAAYGLFYAYSNSFVPRKTDDRINLSSRYGYQLADKSNFFLVGLFDLQTQFTKGYDYEAPNWRDFSTSNFASPLYLTLAPGIEYRRGSRFSVFFSPIALRGTFADDYYTLRDSAGAFGVPYGKTFRLELGAYLSARFDREFSKHFSYRSRLDLYSNYLAKDSYINGNLVKRDNPGNIDILWDNNLTFTFAKYFAINIGVTAQYDNDIPYTQTYLDNNGIEQPKDEPMSGLGWWQIKEVMSIGFNYKF